MNVKMETLSMVMAAAHLANLNLTMLAGVNLNWGLFHAGRQSLQS